MNDSAQNPNQNSYADVYMPPSSEQPSVGAAPAAAPTDTSVVNSLADAQATSKGPVSQTLEDQNIFYLLGVQDGSDEDKEAFLDELQQVIWEDFLENDVELLVTEEELEGLKRIRAVQGKTELQMQEDIIVYLEKLIPDLEEILLEKALELKEDMVKERIVGMRQFFASQPEKLKTLDEAEALIADDQWRSAAELLNSVQ